MAFSLEEYLKKIKDMQTPPPYQTPGYNPNLPTPGITPPGGGYPNSAPTMPQPNTKMDKLKELLQNPGIGNLIGALITKATGGDPQGTIKYMDEQRQLGKENALKEKELKSRYDIAGMQEKGATDRQLRQFEQENKLAKEEWNRELDKLQLTAEQRAIFLEKEHEYTVELADKKIDADERLALADHRRKQIWDTAKMAHDQNLQKEDIEARKAEGAANRAQDETQSIRSAETQKEVSENYAGNRGYKNDLLQYGINKDSTEAEIEYAAERIVSENKDPRIGFDPEAKQAEVQQQIDRMNRALGREVKTEPPPTEEEAEEESWLSRLFGGGKPTPEAIEKPEFQDAVKAKTSEAETKYSQLQITGALSMVNKLMESGENPRVAAERVAAKLGMDEEDLAAYVLSRKPIFDTTNRKWKLRGK